MWSVMADSGGDNAANAARVLLENGMGFCAQILYLCNATHPNEALNKAADTMTTQKHPVASCTVFRCKCLSASPAKASGFSEHV